MLLGCFTTGCVHDQWTFGWWATFRSSPRIPASARGPVTLIPTEVVQAQAEAEAKIEAVKNATLKEKLEQRVDAERTLTKLRGELGEDHVKAQDQRQVVANLETEIAEITAKASAHHALASTNAKPKTVLVIRWTTLAPGPSGRRSAATCSTATLACWSSSSTSRSPKRRSGPRRITRS